MAKPYDWGQKPYKAEYGGPSFNLVRSINFSDHFQKRGGRASVAQLVAGSHPQGKVR